MDTISITFPAVKINVPLDGITFDSLEQTVFDITQAAGRKTIEKALCDIDDALRDARPEGTLKNTGKREKYFLTRLGDIRYERTRYIDKATGKGRYLLEEKLKVGVNQRISLVRAKIELFISSITTYRATEENTELLTGYRRSHESIRQSVIKEAEKIIAHQDASIEKTRRLEDKEDPTSPTHDIVYIESDSTFIRRQRSRKRSARSCDADPKHRRRSIEIKLGIGYTDKVRRYNKGRGKDLKLKNKFTFVSTGIGSAFMEALSLIAEKKLGLSKAKAIIFGGDGGSYIMAGIRDYFVNVIYILCKFHTKRNIKRCLATRPNTQDTINKLLKKDRIDRALSILKLIRTKSRDRRDRKAIADLYTYIANNRDGINPLKHVADKAIRDRIKGAGAMESNVDKFLAHRFKKRGMSWSEKGALSLLKVKETIANGEWDSWWLEKRDQKIEISPEPLKQLSAKSFWKKQEDAPALIEADIPALYGPDRDEQWAKVIRELQKIDYYKYAGATA